MTRLNKTWAIEELQLFLTVTAKVRLDPAPGAVYPRYVMKNSLEAQERLYVVEQILEKVLPGWSRDKPVTDKGYLWLRTQVVRAKVALERESELAEYLGNDAPEMDTSNLHPWVWQDGQGLWRGGHYHQAVMVAAVQVNAEAQKKLGRRDVSETDLFNQAFSLDAPKEEKPRLRLMENDGSPTYRSLHGGVRAFAEGLYSAIRNPGMHNPPAGEGDEEQLALEQLAAFSLLARWVDEATVVRA